jgi:YCII-related domain
MKKFFLLHYGFVTPTKEIGAAWKKWFDTYGDKFVDSGTPFAAGIEIKGGETKHLAVDKEAITGYSIINAESMDEAEKIAQSCPSVTSIRVYEAKAM